MKRVLLLAALFVALPAHAASVKNAGRDPNVLNQIDFAPARGAVVPSDVTFFDENGKPVKLGSFFGEKPVVLLPVYYECPMLCNLTLNGILRASRAIRASVGPDYQIVAFSINPKETAELAMGKRETYVKGYNRPNSENGWHFLIGPEASIQRVTKAINFKYVYDANSDQYAHASGLVVVTPDGRVNRALYGPEFAPRDLKLAITEASKNKVGNITEKVLLYCYAFDGSTGRYSLAIMHVVKLGGAATVACLFTGVGFAIRRERKRGPKSGDKS